MQKGFNDLACFIYSSEPIINYTNAHELHMHEAI